MMFRHNSGGKLKLAIIGGNGAIGSTTAFLTAQKGIYDEIKLLGRKTNVLKNHAMDMEHALMPFSKTVVSFAEYEDISDCQVIFIAVGAPERKVESREEYLKDNIRVIDEVLENSCYFNKDAVILTATNPIDVFNYYLYKKLKRDRMKMLGFSANDSLRLRWAVAEKFNIDFNKTEAYCIGEHGEDQVPLMNCIKYDGKKFDVEDETKSEIKNILVDWFLKFQNLDAKRTSGWTSSVTASEVLEAIACDSGKIIECSVPLGGELGFRDVSLGMMVKLGKEGAMEIIVPELNDGEKSAINKAAAKIKQQITHLNI
ncbi:L-lactate dehydrogenase [anaerobic digester metagenome]